MSELEKLQLFMRNMAGTLIMRDTPLTVDELHALGLHCLNVVSGQYSANFEGWMARLSAQYPSQNQ